MTGAMYAAIGGLKTHMANLNVIGNNIANVNTNAYKAQRMTFQESLYTTSRSGSDGGVTTGGNNPSQIGYGASIGSIDLNMAAGTYSPTGFGLDCMIDGEGFFMVGDKDLNISTAEDLTKPMLSRMGDFWKDPEGYICDRRGNVLYGFATVYNPDYKQGASDTEIADAVKAGKNITDKLIVSSQLVPLRLPLAADVPTKENGGLNDDGTPKWATGDPVYQMLGVPNGAQNGARQNVSLADPAYYDDKGKLDSTKLDMIGGTVKDDGTGNKIDKTYLDSMVIPKPNMPQGEDEADVIGIKNLQINEQGGIFGTCENGQTVMLGYAAIANVDSPDGVTHLGGCYYQAMEGSGDISISGVGGVMTGKFLNNKVTITGTGNNPSNPPDSSEAIGQGKGIKIRNAGLEASTADVATEFSNMILTQRGYQANTRIVTVTDSMLEELVNMKR